MAITSQGKFTKLTDETVKKLEEIFLLDGTVEEACYFAGISKQTLYNWFLQNPKMKERMDNMRSDPFLKARRTIVENLSNPQYAFE